MKKRWKVRKSRFRVWLDANTLYITAVILSVAVVVLIVFGFYLDYNRSSACISHYQERGKGFWSSIAMCLNQEEDD